MSRATLFGISFCAVIAIKAFSSSPMRAPQSEFNQLAVRESPDRILLIWNGQIAAPMRNEIAAALDRFKADPRLLVLALNSPGGSISHGHEVMAAIREAERKRRIDTHLERGSTCASMCVPIFLLGANRTAHPDAYFMFHEASLAPNPDYGKTGKKPMALKNAEKQAAMDPAYRKVIEAAVTDRMYENDIGAQRVNSQWLSMMRAKIIGKDIWVTAQQLVDARSGVIDALPSRGLTGLR